MPRATTRYSLNRIPAGNEVFSTVLFVSHEYLYTHVFILSYSLSVHCQTAFQVLMAIRNAIGGTVKAVDKDGAPTQPQTAAAMEVVRPTALLTSSLSAVVFLNLLLRH